jgi:outer membrane protein OmpA-like peptidoglycan-associated protein
MRKSNTTRAFRMGLAVVFAMITITLISGSAAAQSEPTPKWDLFAGYQWMHPGINVPFGDPNNPTPYAVPDMAKGGGAALTYNFDPHWGGEADFGYSESNSNKESTVSGGPRFIWRTDDGNYFIHALLSYNYLSINGLNNGSNGIGAILGGGFDLPITKNISWRVFQADYVWARHNYADDAAPEFPNLRRASADGARLRTGIVFSWGGAEPVAPTAACSVQPAEVMVGEPINATVTAANFNPKHTVTYSWSGNGGGSLVGKDTTASIDTNNAAPGSYTITAKVTDPKEKKNNEASCTANYTIKPLPPKNPPTMSISANPTETIPGGVINLSANCTSPDGVAVSVANWTSSAGSVSGSGTSATFNTAGQPAGPITVTATCTDARGLNAQASTQFTVQNPPPPPVDQALEARLALHSVYFATNMPTIKDPNAGLLPSQQKILIGLANDYKKYLQSKPDVHLILKGHADVRGPVDFNQKLSERRAAKVKSFLVEQGIPEGDIETQAFGKEHNLTEDEVKQSIENNTDLTTEERHRALARINVIKLASNRRVDITLNVGGTTENSVRQFPFNAADAMSLIGGREGEMKKPVRKTAKKPMKKQQ